ncbi:MAG: M20/M25/M40 family metallo-hydrolase [Deltaproteobacteria bacterium]|nr:M20/M25/M40 family metallo-hydrolase [Deltaproteobacteria bacterium]MCL5278058.1 M20/M25/M40 family metallo-hydrolase [Deltaproteobacteria bacterium]
MEHEINWKQITEEAASTLSSYIKINTTNPPGNEREAAEFLAGILRRESFEPEVLRFNDRRSNLVCRFKGSGSDKPLLLLSHMDVVGAVASDWEVAPFSGAIKGGYVWGRGAIDCKGPGVMELMAFLMLKRAGVTPKRDILLLANADEEAGGGAGAAWVVENHWDKVAAGFVLNEGGVGISGTYGHDLMMPCFGEKGPLWIQLKARGESGHGSMPTPDNPNNRMAAALARIARYDTRIKLMPEVRDVLLTIGKTMKFPASLIAPLVVNGPVLNVFRKRLNRSRKINAILRNTISITNIRAGFKENVIPSECDAVLDCRLLPGEDKDGFLEELKGVIADPDIEMKVMQYHSPSLSPASDGFMQALRKVVSRNNPDAVFLPMLAPGYTDSRFFREKGAIAYGLVPCLFAQEEIDSMHGTNERISMRCLEDGIRNIFDMCAGF